MEQAPKPWRQKEIIRAQSLLGRGHQAGPWSVPRGTRALGRCSRTPEASKHSWRFRGGSSAAWTFHVEQSSRVGGPGEFQLKHLWPSGQPPRGGPQDSPSGARAGRHHRSVSRGTGLGPNATGTSERQMETSGRLPHRRPEDCRTGILGLPHRGSGTGCRCSTWNSHPDWKRELFQLKPSVLPLP